MSTTPTNSDSSGAQVTSQINGVARDVQSMQTTQIFKDDTGTRRVLLGKGLNGFYGLKVSKTGEDVYEATDSQLIFNSNQNMFKIATTVTGTYTITSGDASANYANFSFAHGQTTKPTVIGSFSNTTDSVSRQLPYLYQAPTSSYFGFSASASVQIYSIDATNINVAVKILDINGTSWLLANTTLSFKFYCLQETII